MIASYNIKFIAFSAQTHCVVWCDFQRERVYLHYEVYVATITAKFRARFVRKRSAIRKGDSAWTHIDAGTYTSAHSIYLIRTGSYL